jgi:hypothetical protein
MMRKYVRGRKNLEIDGDEFDRMLFKYLTFDRMLLKYLTRRKKNGSNHGKTKR